MKPDRSTILLSLIPIGYWVFHTIKYLIQGNNTASLVMIISGIITAFVFWVILPRLTKRMKKIE